MRTRGLNAVRASRRLLSRRFIKEFGALHASVRDLGAQRAAMLRIVVLSRNATTAQAQREYWSEFTWVDQEYRVAVQRLARFCEAHDRSPQRKPPRPAAAAAVPGQPFDFAR